MTTDMMREAIKRRTARDCSLGLDGMGRPLWHALAGYLAVPVTITMQWQLSTGNIPEELDHGIRTHVPKKNRPPVVSNMRPPTMLNEGAKIYSTALLLANEDMMEQPVPQQQVGFMKKRQMMSHVARCLQRVENTQWGAERSQLMASGARAHTHTHTHTRQHTTQGTSRTFYRTAQMRSQCQIFSCTPGRFMIGPRGQRS